MDPVVVEAAINGATPKSRNPHVPIAPDEIAADVLRCLGAGAAIVHVRVGLEDYAGARTPANVELVEEVVTLAHTVGRPIATTNQASALLHLPR